MITVNDLAKMIDHSLLHPTMTDEILERECKVAIKYDVASVCIKPYAVAMAVELLEDSNVKVGSVIGFPHGNSHWEIKVEETLKACEDGAAEIDMVINIGKAIGGDWDYVKEEIHAVNQAAICNHAILKVIFENDYLTNDIIEELCRICNEVNPAFVKTSSGYGFVKQENGMYSYKGATAEHLTLMRRVTDKHIEVKAAGGVRTLKDLLFVRSLGVTRIGATATAAILDEAAERIARGENLEELELSSARIGGAY